MVFHVFVEGPTDGTPAGVARLAEAIAQHYGLPAPDLLARLQKGRFRVKGNIDRTLAEQYCRDLERLGARCVIEEATPQNSQRATPLPFPAVRPATPPAGLPVAQARPSAPPSALPPAAARSAAPASVLPPAAAKSAAPASVLPPAAAKPATPPAGTPSYQSGLSAAFSSNDAPAANLGALEQDGLSFSLSSVDGADDKAASPTAFAPPADALSASIGPAPDKPKPATGSAANADKPKDVPLDLFAPPDAQDAQLSVDLATDEPPRRRSEPVIAVPEAGTAEPPSRTSEPVMRKSQPSLQAAAPASMAASSSKLGPLADLRVRFAAGVLLAILIGFVPAHLVASMREGSAYKAIDDKVMAAQQLADTPDAYAQLDRMRADQLARKQGEQRNTMIIALAIWGLVGGAVAFAWFKKVPWERFE